MVGRLKRVLVIEGGGKTGKQELRRLYRQFFERAVGEKAHQRNLDIVPGGGNDESIKEFARQKSIGLEAMLLIDSTKPVPTPTEILPWTALGKPKPPHATDDDCHLMVPAIEAWVMADREALRRFYGRSLVEGSLPPSPPARLESELKSELVKATRLCKGKEYREAHCPEILATCDPSLIRKQCPWADRFFTAIGG